MKRSRMIELMALEFMKNEGSTTPRKIAEALLKCAEEAGMLPPCKSNYIIHVNPNYNAYEWELEDEEITKKGRII